MKYVNINFKNVSSIKNKISLVLWASIN
jgi:hypothetical protein